MIGRRDLLAGGAAMAAMAGTGFAAPTDVHFEVIRKGGKIGQQSVTFQQRDGVLVATTAAEIVVRFGPIALFRYTHSVRETWRDGQFETLDSTTDDDGKPFKVHAERGAAGVTVEASTIARAVLPPETIPLTHWNILCMERPLFNPQDGTRIDSRVIRAARKWWLWRMARWCARRIIRWSEKWRWTTGMTRRKSGPRCVPLAPMGR